MKSNININRILQKLLELRDIGKTISLDEELYSTSLDRIGEKCTVDHYEWRMAINYRLKYGFPKNLYSCRAYFQHKLSTTLL